MESTIKDRQVDAVKDMLLDIYTLHGKEQYANGYYDESHIQNKFEIVWIQHGTGFHEVNASRHMVTGNKIYCAIPGQLHHLQIEPGSRGFIICFNQSFLYEDENFCEVYHNGLFPLMSLCSGISLEKEIAGDMLEILLKMKKESDNSALLSSEMLRRYLKIFLIYIIRQIDTMQPGRLVLKDVGLFNKFIVLLEKNFRVKKMVKDYAKELFLSSSYLNERIRKTSGYPASYHISQRVVQEAKRRAVYSGNSMKEIAFDLGFEDVAHFSKYFKNVSGKNFTDYRKQCFAEYS